MSLAATTSRLRRTKVRTMREELLALRDQRSKGQRCPECEGPRYVGRRLPEIPVFHAPDDVGECPGCGYAVGPDGRSVAFKLHTGQIVEQAIVVDPRRVDVPVPETDDATDAAPDVVFPRDSDKVIRRVRRFYGAAARLFLSGEREVMAEAGARTGKSWVVLAKFDWLARKYPGSRWLLARKHFASMHQTTIPDWCDDVLWPRHPSIVGTAAPERRHKYVYPNGSLVYLTGFSDSAAVDKIMSGKFDGIALLEAHQFTQRDIQMLLTRLSNDVAGYRQMVFDINPQGAGHPLNKRLGVTRIGFRHQDNPFWFNHAVGQWSKRAFEYIGGTLQRLTGAPRARLLEHQWVSAEGLVWPEWDPEVHIVDAAWDTSSDAQEHPRGLRLTADECERLGWRNERVAIRWAFASVDWGTTAPGVIQVWGVDGEHRMWLLAEVYRTRQAREWWADRMVELWQRFGPLERIVCDPEDPDNIRLFNDRISAFCGRPMPMLAIKANNRVEAGVELVRDKLNSRQILALPGATCTFGRDEDRAREGLPVSFFEEVGEWMYETHEDGRPNRDRPDPAGQDHACDATRYAAMYCWRRDPAVDPTKPKHKPGTVAHVMERQRKKGELLKKGERLFKNDRMATL